MDFNDVFGGPPRRFSMQQVRSSFKDSKEKPVFGDDFYHDIFRGDANSDRHAFLCRSSSSKITSPAPLVPNNFGSSLPIFSLPRKLTTSNGRSSPGHQELMVNDDDIQLNNEEEPLSSLDPKGGGSENMKNEKANVEQHFHFSIYNWVGKGVPMLIPVLGDNSLRSRNTNKHGITATKEDLSVTSPELLTRKFQDFYQQVFDVYDLKSVQGPDEKMVKPQSLNDILVKDRREGPPCGDVDDGQMVKETEVKSPKDAATNKNGAKGKVREAEILDKTTVSKNKPDARRRNRSYRWDATLARQSGNKDSTKASNEKEKFSRHYADHVKDDLFKNEEEEQHYPTKAATYTSDHSYFTIKKASPSEMFQQDSHNSQENDDAFTEINFVVEVLSDDPDDVTPTESLDDPKTIDAKIQQWSAGKKANIHSLLSTLQFVLWSGSGWKPARLCDLLEANSVKKAYQRALLCLHPDKLQQKNASSHQKYIAEKVFDILQEAWEHFNSLAPH